jgi:hypothetical protein
MAKVNFTINRVGTNGLKGLHSLLPTLRTYHFIKPGNYDYIRVERSLIWLQTITAKRKK